MIEKVNSWLIVGLCFFVSLSTALGNIIAALILLLWLFHADFKNQFLRLRSNKIALASLIYVCIHVVGILWSNDISQAFHVVLKHWKFLILPILMLYVRKKHISIYINAFIASVFISNLFMILISLGIIEPFGNAHNYSPEPFMSYIITKPLLAIAIYILASRLVFGEIESKFLKYLTFFLTVFFIFSMFHSTGRVGQVLFFLAIFLISFQYFKNSFFKVLFYSITASIIFFGAAYAFSDNFSERVNETFHNIINYEDDRNTSIGKRLSFTINGLDVFSDHPIIGVGTGDLFESMKEKHSINTPEVPAPDNPHNQFIMIMVQFGVIGLIFLLWFFYIQIISSKKIDNIELSRLGFAIPIMYFFASFGDSYLFIHAGSLFYVTMTSVIFAHHNY